ncbi:hypothetical protein FDP22_01420 [Paroceanicella profunda]|uniref:Uncharacterized protein n=1 Tax=Paroceanicella profunda TaxID=2579971 RepID=A0A5B8FW14_9RHOB|nr:hypothetical protein [Paroceanicella profunda]QDL90562.1 hypothetical protein FDP22_01420 [Paroceanicella profunda]
MILSCDKTGRWWQVSSAAEAMRLARTLGLATFMIGAGEAVSTGAAPSPRPEAPASGAVLPDIPVPRPQRG